MATYKTTGIVIGRTNFGEADRIIRLLTPDHGKISVVAKGVRKIKSRSAGHLELFGEVGLMLAQGRGALDIITSAKLAWYPHQLATDYARLSLAYQFAIIIDHVTQDRHAQPELYAHLSEGLRTVEEHDALVLPELWFKLRLLSLIGLRPELQRCFSCHVQSADTVYHFDPAHGIVCAGCAPATAASMSVAGIKLWRLLCDHPYAAIREIAGAAELAKQTLPSCDGFSEYHLGRGFRATMLP